MQKSYDIVIVGGGMAGAAAACALRRVSSTYKIALFDPAEHQVLEYPDPASAPPHPRSVALSPASVDLLQRVDIWNEVMEEGRVAPYYDMYVSDALGPGAIHFSASETSSGVLGYVSELAPLENALRKRVASLDIDVHKEPIESAQIPSAWDDPSPVVLNEKVEADLIVCADGANSSLRKLAGISTVGWKYGERALVCSVDLGEGMFNTSAFQRFLPSGPIALLPAHGSFATIVWSMPEKQAISMSKMDEASFTTQLQKALAASFQRKMPFPFDKLVEYLPAGPTVAPPWVERVVSPRMSFPLGVSQAATFVRPRLCLVGDAAHTMHPLAGQGLNQGLADVVCLVNAVSEGAKNGGDPGSHSVLHTGYHNQRFIANATVAAGVDTLRRIFSVDFEPFTALRSSGMLLTHGIAPLKQASMAVAMGEDIRLKD